MGEKVYLRSFDLVPDSVEMQFVLGQKMTCFNGVYPFKLFPDKGLSRLEFTPVTIFYGGNGSGKTTLLNIIAEKLKVTRHSAFSGSAFFQDYVSMCRADTARLPSDSQILTSDDVSDYLLDLRHLNDGIDSRREDLMEEYTDRKYQELRFTSLEDYDQWKEGYDAKRLSKSRFVKERLMRNVDMFSNGETAMRYYTERIRDHALYLIDEPENSLSARFQLDLLEYLSIAARYDGCQFIISTHSPFLLSLPQARIYDLDERPVAVKPWTELETVRMYYDFFRKHHRSFENV